MDARALNDASAKRVKALKVDLERMGDALTSMCTRAGLQYCKPGLDSVAWESNLRDATSHKDTCDSSNHYNE